MKSTLKKFLIPCIIVVAFSAVSTLPLPWNETVEDAFIDLQFKIRGERDLSEDIVLVYIGAEDVESLGGWPITRDYYGYLAHVLNKLGAKVIGIYLLFDSPDPRYPEFDQILADFFEMANNVCLINAFYQLDDEPVDHSILKDVPSRLLAGEKIILPIERLSEQVAGVGFSNLSENIIHHKAPLIAVHEGGIVPSFGCELARLYLNASPEIKTTQNSVIFSDSDKNQLSVQVDQFGQLRLNHFGDIDHIAAIGLVDLLQTYATSSDSLNFEGKIVIVDVTAPGIPTLHSSPLAATLPASLIHATVIENILQQNYLRLLPPTVDWILILVLVMTIWQIWQPGISFLRLGISLIIIIFYWIAVFLLFSKSNLIIPLFYPTLAFVATLSASVIIHSHRRKSRDISVKSLLEEQITKKEKQLAEVRIKSEELQTQLQNESTISEQSTLLAEQRNQTIIELEKQLRDLQTCMVPEKPETGFQFSKIIHSADSKMTEILELVSKVSSDDIPVLILGETGTGKEMIAHAIHQSSKRNAKPFVAVNCGALSETLLESELFGHEKGSFTGAHAQRKGRFELADGGTIFLDEITETTPTFQARLLRILQEGAFERLGGERTIKVNLRVLTATNKDIQKEVDAVQFRTDLFYRLNGFPITLPALRERPQDIPLLVMHFLKKHGYQSVAGISDLAANKLQRYCWPGNVRELENAIRRAAIIVQSEGRDLIQINDLPVEIQQSKTVAKQQVDFKPLEEQILESLRSMQFSRSAITLTAQALGNRDRGTITEYFRGICFEQFVQSNFDFDLAAKCIAATNDEQILANVKNKINGYVKNLYPLPDSSNADETEIVVLSSQFKGLPKKYHPYLQQVINYLRDHPENSN